MRKERLHTEDVMAMVVGLHYPSAFQRYMIARQKAVIHKIAEVNTLLERTFGVLLYTEDLISLCALAGIHRKEAKMLRDYEYLSCKQQERLKDEFIGGFQRLGYHRESIYSKGMYKERICCSMCKELYLSSISIDFLLICLSCVWESLSVNEYIFIPLRLSLDSETPYYLTSLVTEVLS